MEAQEEEFEVAKVSMVYHVGTMNICIKHLWWTDPQYNTLELALLQSFSMVFPSVKQALKLLTIVCDECRTETSKWKPYCLTEQLLEDTEAEVC